MDIAFVTGASRGIGSAIAIRLAKDGFLVVIGYHKNKFYAEKIVEKIKKFGRRSVAIQIDVSCHLSVRSAFNKILKLGTLKVLVNNAAISQIKPFLKITEKDWDGMMNTNLRGAFFCIQEALPLMMKKRYGRIINISSIGGQWGGMNQIHYAISKAGIIGLTRSIAKTFSNKGITCNAISPGLVKTDMTKYDLKINLGKSQIGQIPIGRIALINEIAGAASFLAGPDGSYITGQTLNLNGGAYFG